jgi:hypothetical protein
MPAGVIGGLLGAALAGVAEVLVFRGLDRPATPQARSLRIIAAAFVAGQAVLGIVVAMLSVSLPDAAISVPVAFVSAAMLGLGAFGVALTYRQRVASGPADDDVRARSRTIVLMAVADAIGILGAVLAILSLFLFSP